MTSGEGVGRIRTRARDPVRVQERVTRVPPGSAFPRQAGAPEFLPRARDLDEHPRARLMRTRGYRRVNFSRRNASGHSVRGRFTSLWDSKRERAHRKTRRGPAHNDHRKRSSLGLSIPRDARRTPRHPRFPPRASSRRRGDACEARRRRPQAAGSHVPVLARGHRCRRPEASKADAVRRPAPRVGLHQRGRGEIQAHGRTGQGTSRARLWKSPRVAPVIPIRRPRVARGANAPLAWYGFFEFSQRRSPPPRPATSFSRFGGPFLV